MRQFLTTRRIVIQRCAAVVLVGLLPTSLLKGAPPVSTPETAVVPGTNRFALDLYGRLRGGSGNLFFSPYSIATALAMTSTGARGATDAQIADTLHAPADPAARHAGFKALIAQINAGASTGETLATANALWLQQGKPFLPAFLQSTRSEYSATAEEVDFASDRDAAREKINAWVEAQTHDKIRNLIGPSDLTALTKLVLTNAIYFKGAWMHPFREFQTDKKGVFLAADGHKINVPLMSQIESCRLFDGGTFQVLELPYSSGRRAMFIALPKKTDGLAALEASLSSTALETWAAKLTPQRVHVTLPRFKLTETFQLGDTLKALGMVDAFDPKRADFSGMTNGRELMISAVIHKAFVDVNEAGTEAAAATGVVMMPRAAKAPPAPPVEFRADHPFLFLIRDQATGTLLFLGRVYDPSA
jgi:serpin B